MYYFGAVATLGVLNTYHVVNYNGLIMGNKLNAIGKLESFSSLRACFVYSKTDYEFLKRAPIVDPIGNIFFKQINIFT